MPHELTRTRIVELEALAADPDGEMTQAEAEEWFAAVDASRPEWPEAVTIEEGEEFPDPSEAEVKLDRWYETPVADILFPLQAAVRVHVPPRFATPRVEARPRGRRRSSHRRAGPARPDDPEPEPDLTALREISPAAFEAILRGAGL